MDILRVRLLATLLLSLPVAGFGDMVAPETLARADAAWERRAEGSAGGRAAEAAAAEAVATAEAAVAAAPGSPEGAWRLMRALWFRGEYASPDPEARKAQFARGREVGERALDLLAAGIGGRRALDRLSPAARAERLAPLPGARPILFWTAVHWGLWGEAFGKLAAARQGVAGRIRDHAETLRALDERFEQAGALRVLGRLHDRAPDVPLITGWVDREVAVASLRRAVELAPGNALNRLYLAEALLAHRPAARAEIERLLAGLAGIVPDPSVLVEETRARDEARALLAARR